MNMSSKKIAIIPARSGSKRIPHKNIRDFCGKPMISYSIKAAIESKLFTEVMVSTDSKKIAEIAKFYGANVPFLRSDRTSDDYATTADVLMEVLMNYRKKGQIFEYVCCIYPTAPFTTADKLKKAMMLMESNQPVEVMPVVPFSYPPQRGFVIDEDKYMKYKYPEYIRSRSQDLEKQYQDAGQFYIYHTEKYLELNGQITGGIMPIIVSELEVQDIDSEEDWKIAELKYYLMERGKSMKKRIGAVIGAGRDSVYTIKKAKEKGVYVVALDGNPQAEGFLYANQAIEVDISDKEKVLRILDEIKPDFIIPVPIGRYLSTMGYINEKYNLPGVKYVPANLSTDKYLFHQKLSECGLRPVKLYLLNKDTDFSQIQIPFPAIIKPRFGSGSRDVFYIMNIEEMEHACKAIGERSEDFILEQAVIGTEYSVDGAVIDGELKITLLRKKIITPIPIRQPVSSFSVVKTEENQALFKRVQDHLQKVFTQLAYDCCLVNADLIINEENIFVIEAAPRPSGHNLHSIFVPLATGIDIAEEYINLLLGEKFSFIANNTKCIQIRFIDFEEMFVNKIPDIQQLNKSGKCNILEWKINIQPGDYMDKVINGHSIMNRGFFIVEGKDERDLLEQSNWVLSQFDVSKEVITSCHCF